MCGRKLRLPWLLLAALFCLSSVFCWAEEDLTEAQVYLLAGEVSVAMKKAGLEEEKGKLYRIFGWFTQKFKTQENQSLEWQNLSMRQEVIVSDLQSQLDKASSEVKNLQEQLPILEDKVKRSETSLAQTLEEKRWDFLKGFGLGVVSGSVLVICAKLVWKQ